MSEQNSHLTETERNTLDRPTFYPSFIILILFIGIGILNIDHFKQILDGMQAWLTQYWGWMSVVSSLLIVFIAFGIAFSPIGSIRLGGKDAKPNFTTWQWFSITLCTGIGIGILFWGIGEPMYHFMSPPKVLGLEPGSRQAGIFAISQSVLHWTIAQYCIYAMCGLAFALASYNLARPLSIAEGLRSVMPERFFEPSKHIIHGLCIFSLCGVVASSMGAGLMQIGSGITYLTGIEGSPLMWGCIGAVVIGLYTGSSVKGLRKGMQFLSSLCTKMFIVLMFFIFFVGPTLFILSMGTEAFGYFIGHFFVNSSLLNTMQPEDAWSANWLVVFMLAFFGYGAPIGLFLARLGRGRTVRQFLLVNILAPTIFVFLWINTFGSTAIHAQWTGLLDIWATVQDKGLESSVFMVFSQCPLPMVTIAFFIVLTIISFATLADPMTAVLATISTKGLSIADEPPTRLKLVWGISTGMVAYLLVISGGLDGLRCLFAVGGFFMMFLTWGLCIAVFKDGMTLLSKTGNVINRVAQ
ncbi:BCCT family transporter [Desulfovibrio sp. OttesenSCG-928-G15]|nr:BCCT family transporter [Desulfovibrio sp. OttesenSCG-928-G15]